LSREKVAPGRLELDIDPRFLLRSGKSVAERRLEEDRIEKDHRDSEDQGEAEEDFSDSPRPRGRSFRGSGLAAGPEERRAAKNLQGDFQDELKDDKEEGEDGSQRHHRQLRHEIADQNEEQLHKSKTFPPEIRLRRSGFFSEP